MMFRSIGHAPRLALAIVIASPSLAQTAQVTVSHNDLDGVILPGQTIRVTVRHSRDVPGLVTCLAHIEGDLNVSPNVGQSSAITSPYLPPLPFWTSVSPGTPNGSGLSGFRVTFPNHPMFWAGTLPTIWVVASVELFSFDWTAPSVSVPTTVGFSWSAAPSAPDLKIFDFSRIDPYPIPTTSTPTSILVLPAPGVVSLLGGGWLCLSARRRR